jgi:hypothetical protein
MKSVIALQPWANFGSHLVRYISQEDWWRPQNLSQEIETVSPWLARQVLSYASGIISPNLIGRGIRLTCWQDDKLELQVPFRWNNCNESREVALGVVGAAAEYALGLYWSRHLDRRLSQVQIQRQNIEVMQPLKQDLVLRFALDSAERERWLFQLRRDGHFTADLQMQVYSTEQILLARVSLNLRIEQQKTLNTPLTFLEGES